LRPLSDAAGHTAAHHETKAKARFARLFDRPKYRQRNIIERMFGCLRENRRIVARFDKLEKSFAAMVSLACAMRCLRHYFSYKA
jgi:transposase